MDFTDTEQEILVSAWLLAREGRARCSRTGPCPTRNGCPTPAGSSATVDANGDTCWFWTSQAGAALDMNALRRKDLADLS
jgi:hypothetical protein